MPAIVHHVDMKTDSTGNTAGYKNAAGEQIMLVSGKTNALTGVVINSIVNLTQVAYDAIGTKDANTLYVIVG